MKVSSSAKKIICKYKGILRRMIVTSSECVSVCLCRIRHYVARGFYFFFFNDTATTEIYTLSLHDALPISHRWSTARTFQLSVTATFPDGSTDRKSTRLNSSHVKISYAVFCLKKKKKK